MCLSDDGKRALARRGVDADALAPRSGVCIWWGEIVGWLGSSRASLGGNVGVDLGWVSASLGNGVGVSVDFWPCLVAMSAWVWVSFGVIGVRRGCGISASLSNGVGVGLASLRLRLVTGGATLADLGNHFRHFDAFWLTLGPLFDDFGCLYKNCTVAQFPMRGHSNDYNYVVFGVSFS